MMTQRRLLPTTHTMKLISISILFLHRNFPTYNTCFGFTPRRQSSAYLKSTHRAPPHPPSANNQRRCSSIHPRRSPPQFSSSFDASIFTNLADEISNTLTLPPTTNLTHFNNAGSSPPPPSVLHSQIRHMVLESLTDGYLANDISHHLHSHTYAAAATIVNARRDSEIALVESATVGWTRLFYAMMDAITIERPVILCSELEYAANVVAAIKASRERGGTVLPMPSETRHSGRVDVGALKRMLEGTWEDDDGVRLDEGRIGMVCVTHVPTNCGVVNPVEDIGRIVAEHNRMKRPRASPVFYLVDACQSVGQRRVDVREIKCHGLTATGRKYLRGPRGTSFLFLSENITLIPSQVDHRGAPVSAVPSSPSFEDVAFEYGEGARRFEFWESNVANRIGLGVAIDRALGVGVDEIERRCAALGGYLRKRLRAMERVYVHHDDADEETDDARGGSSRPKQCDIVCFSVGGWDAATIKSRMLDKGFLLAVTPATSTPFDSSRMGITCDFVRVSLSYFNNVGEIDAFCDALVIMTKNDVEEK